MWVADSRAPARRSPLQHRAPAEGSGGAVHIAELPFVGKSILRVNHHDGSERVKPVLGFGLPSDPLTTAGSGDVSVLWLGPDEWMAINASAEGSPALAARISEALSGVHHQFVDVGDYYTIIEIGGAKARELLMKLTTLDLHPRSFRAGMVTGCVVGRANVTLWQTIDDAETSGPAFRLFIRWSMADYLWCALADAGREWGVPEQIPLKGEKLVVD